MRVERVRRLIIQTASVFREVAELLEILVALFIS